ncbi:MAG: hypothetical protein ABL967_01360 [Bryobacteraceae bacterium]
MLHMAAGAIGLVGGLGVIAGVKTCTRDEPPLDFSVTFQTLETERASPQAVALATLRDPFQPLVSLG